MVSDTDSTHRTNFTLSIEAAEGVTTGISAHDRAHTVKTAVAPDARPEDLRQPGHVFPLMAQPGGVLTRAGHTEAGCDLARLAGFSPAAMIVEILNDDGTMARRPDLELFAKTHDLKIGTIADLIRYRFRRTSVRWNASTRKRSRPNSAASSCRATRTTSTDRALALVAGDLVTKLPLALVHMLDTLRAGAGVSAAMALALAPLQRHCIGCSRAKRPAARNDLARPHSAAEVTARAASSDQDAAAYPASPRHGIAGAGNCAQILNDLGLKRMRVLSAPKQLQGLAAFDLEVTGYVDGGE